MTGLRTIGSGWRPTHLRPDDVEGAELSILGTFRFAWRRDHWLLTEATSRPDQETGCLSVPPGSVSPIVRCPLHLDHSLYRRR